MMFPRTGKTQACLQWCDVNILLPITVCFILGIVTGKFFSADQSIPASRIILVLLSLPTLLLYVLRKRRTALFLCLPLFFLVGYIHVGHCIQAPEIRGNIYHLIKKQSYVTLVGTLATMIKQTTQTSRLQINVRKILLHNKTSNWQSVHGRIQLSMRGVLDNLHPGDTLMILVKVQRISNFKTPGVFDYKGYMAARGIFVSGWINNRQDILRVQDRTKTYLQDLFYLPELVRQKIAHFLTQKLNTTLSGLYQALLIGSRAGVKPETLEQFKATGTMHLLAISGLHMGLLGLMIGTLLSRLLKRSQWLLLHVHVPALALAGTLPVLIGYAFIAGMNIPVLRAVIMAAILLTAVILRRQYSMLHLVATAALIVLSISPLALFTASFQLSFSAVTTLALFLPQLLDTTKITPRNHDKYSRIIGYVKTAILVSISASLGTLPFMLLHFNRFSMIGPIMNLLIEPLLCFWALPWGLAAIPLMFIAPNTAVLLLNIGGLGITAGQYLASLGAAIPCATLWTITPNATEIIIYGLLLLLWCLYPQSIRAKIFILSGALLLTLHFTQDLWWPEQPDESLISYLDVGQGSSTFMHLPDGSRILIDGGGSRGSTLDIGQRVIAPYLWKQRIWKLDQAVISHPHSDHFNGLDFILAHFQPETLYINGDQRSEGIYNRILDQARQQGIRIIVPEAGRSLVKGNNFLLTVLGMNGLLKDRHATVNDRCLVLKYSHGSRAFLFPADITKKSEQLLLRKQIDVTADVLTAAHHGSATSNSKTFIAAVHPSIIIVSAGKNGQAHYPAPANSAFWQTQHIQTFITRDQGTITCATNGTELTCIPMIKYLP